MNGKRRGAALLRRVSAIAATAGVVLFGSGSVASGASGVFVCATLQAALNNAQPGDVLTLDGVCTNQSFTLPTGVPITLQGDPTNGLDGFDGNVDASTPILSGLDVGTTAIRSLFFRNASLTNGSGGGGDSRCP
jgi:hypothetical protein